MPTTNETLTPKQERAIAVAKDVLKSIKRYKAIRTGKAFVKMYSPKTKYKDGKYEDTEVEKIIEANKKDSKATAKKLQPYCEVCGLGACLMSVVTLENKFKFSGLDGQYNNMIETDDMVRRLKAVFSMHQMYLIENAFERGRGYFQPSNVWNLDPHVNEKQIEIWESSRQAAITFGKKYGAAADRLRAIMKNIIANEGVFVPA
jgi:hypothetical protein